MEKTNDEEINSIKKINLESIEQKEVEYNNQIQIKEKEIYSLKDEIKQLIENNKIVFKSPKKVTSKIDFDTFDLKQKNEELIEKHNFLSDLITSQKIQIKEFANLSDKDNKKTNLMSKKIEELESIKNDLLNKNNNFEKSIIKLNEKIQKYKIELKVKDEIIENKQEEMQNSKVFYSTLKEQFTNDKTDNNQMLVELEMKIKNQEKELFEKEITVKEKEELLVQMKNELDIEIIKSEQLNHKQKELIVIKEEFYEFKFKKEMYKFL